MVMSLADRVTVLDFGRRIADGTPAEVQTDPEVIRAYLGSGDEINPSEAAEAAATGAHPSETPGMPS
jgi:branched-chain amino acid transport system ATP-binding protein